MSDIVKRLRYVEGMPDDDVGAFQWYGDITDEAAACIESLRQQLIGLQGGFDKDQDRISTQSEMIAEYEAENQRVKVDAIRELAEATAERDTAYKIAAHYRGDRDAIQAREQRYREGLEAAYKMATESPDDQPFDWAVFCEMLHSTLAPQQDASALEALVAKAGEVMRERCAQDCIELFINDCSDSEVIASIRALPGVTIGDLK